MISRRTFVNGIAAGVAGSRVGPLIDDAIQLPPAGMIRTSERTWTGQVVSVDRFGNLITNLVLSQLPDLARRQFILKVGSTELSELAPSYSFGEPGNAILVPGSNGSLEIAINQDSAASRLGVGCGASVTLALS